MAVISSCVGVVIGSWMMSDLMASRNQESGIRNILLSPMASNIKYTMYSIHVTNEQKYQIKCKTVMTWPWARGTPTKTAACSRWHRSHPIRFKIKLSGLLMVN